jgi:hypothetical protein
MSPRKSETLVADVVMVEPTRRVRRRRHVPDLPLIHGEVPLYWWSMDVPADGEWHYVFVSGEAIRAYLKSKKKVFGCTLFEQRIVLFSLSLLEPENKVALRSTFRHETYHVRTFGNAHTAMTNALLGGRTPEGKADREERMIDHLTHTDDGLFDIGIMRLPPLPKVP